MHRRAAAGRHDRVVRGARRRAGRAAPTCSSRDDHRGRAILLTGGSAFASAAAVERYLEEHRIGSEIGPVIVPTVPAAVIFDLAVGDDAAPGRRRRVRRV